ncbi:lipase family protein [Pelagerythrobacter rhizovicinus]|uniref:Lipase n=1 Tax=Pelagerythrobacter rhizovicinus TaxID=2268576 RepID=A0A4Q2KMZ3_9SPHN|nr:lipase family protein [Pelagerythrobacter rhizovicinus]RXZ64521.1 lipase [Pelagerythrobacter rhizovicinus]
MTRRSAPLAVLLALAVLAGIPGTSTGQDQRAPVHPAEGSWITNPPGSIARADPLDLPVPGARAWRVLYRSSGARGEQIEVSGVIVAPDRPPPPNGWPTVAWAHPTTGIASKCAPSRGHHFEKTVPNLAELVRRGYVVAATDYEGLGTEGVHPYLVGSSAAQTVLDSVRAARSLAGAGSEFVVWGHSQGGHAALWTGELAASYAPDLTLLGVAAAAPATELAHLFEDDLDTEGGKAFTALALLSWSKVYDIDLSAIVEPKAVPGVRLIGDGCMTNALGLLVDGLGLHLLPHNVLRADPTRVSPWREIIARNTPTSVGQGVPVLIAQGTKDTIIAPAVSRDFARRLCSQGTSTHLIEMEADHLGIAKLSADRVADWIDARFARAEPQRGCLVPSE